MRVGTHGSEGKGESKEFRVPLSWLKGLFCYGPVFRIYLHHTIFSFLVCEFRDTYPLSGGKGGGGGEKPTKGQTGGSPSPSRQSR